MSVLLPTGRHLTLSSGDYFLSLDQAKETLGAIEGDTTHDLLIEGLVESAESIVSDILGYSVRSASVVNLYSGWSDYLQLSEQPASNIAESSIVVKYYDPNVAVQTLNSNDYQVFSQGDRMLVRPMATPTVQSYRLEPVLIEYTLGDIPDTSPFYGVLVQCIKYYVSMNFPAVAGEAPVPNMDVVDAYIRRLLKPHMRHVSAAV